MIDFDQNELLRYPDQHRITFDRDQVGRLATNLTYLRIQTWSRHMIMQLMKLTIGSVFVYLAIHFIRVGGFADVVPIGYTAEPQVGWRVQAAFILVSIELIAAGVSILSGLFLTILAGGQAIRKVHENHRERAVGHVCPSRVISKTAHRSRRSAQ